MVREVSGDSLRRCIDTVVRHCKVYGMKTCGRDPEGRGPQEVALENVEDFVVGESTRRWGGVPGIVVGSIFGDRPMKSHDD